MKTSSHLPAYLLVLVIWSTTPLAIKFSNSNLHFSTALLFRVFGAAVILYTLLRLRGLTLFSASSKRHETKLYGAACFIFFPNLFLTYWAVQYISSGLAAVIFSLAPLGVGFWSLLLLKTNVFRMSSIIASLMAIAGLLLLFADKLSAHSPAIGAAVSYQSSNLSAALGVLAMVIATLSFGLSSVLIKRDGANTPPLKIVTGGHVFACIVILPFALVLDPYFAERLGSESPNQRSLTGILYLVLAGSVIANLLYYRMLRLFSAFSLSLITLLTPMLALYLGVILDGEVISQRMLIGSALIVAALGLYLELPSRAMKRWRAV